MEAPKLSHFEICKTVAQDVIKIWVNTSIPCIEEKSVVYKVQRLLKSAHDSQKANKKWRERYLSLHENKFDKLFDLARCRCAIDVANCVCNCPENTKIPIHDLPFMLDQRDISAKGRQLYLNFEATLNLKQL